MAAEIGAAVAVPVDVGPEAAIAASCRRAQEANGPIDLFFSNAGIARPAGGPEAPDDELQRTWEINVMAHVWAARALLPEMRERGRGLPAVDRLGRRAADPGLGARPTR